MLACVRGAAASLASAALVVCFGCSNDAHPDAVGAGGSQNQAGTAGTSLVGGNPGTGAATSRRGATRRGDATVGGASSGGACGAGVSIGDTGGAVGTSAGGSDFAVAARVGGGHTGGFAGSGVAGADRDPF